MGFLRKTLAVTGWTSLGTAIGYIAYTRKSKVYDLPPTDYLLGTTMFARLNPYNNPTMQDICIRKVPITQIRPELLEKEGALVEAFSAGVWSRWGYAPQRRVLSMASKGPETAAQLWTRKELEQSTYEPGTVVTDHFEVLNKTANSIVLRAGDSPRNQDIREFDGLVELTTDIREDEGIVEFGMKSIFYNGVAVDDQQYKNFEKFVPWIKPLHEKYEKILVESAIRNCMRS